MDEKGDTVELQLSFGAMKMTWAGDHFNAEWKQGGATFPLELKRVAEFPKKLVPQTPVAPFPYTDELLSIAGANGVTLGATLSIPTGIVKPNVVILVHGSGPVTRDGGHRLRMAAQPFLRVMLMANPQSDWRRVRCPVLLLNGSLDHQVPPESLAGIVASLREGGNKQGESAVIPSLNHLFQTAKTGAENEYGVIDEIIAPVALQQIAGFVRKQ